MAFLFFDLDGTLMVNPFGGVVFPAVTRLLAKKTGLPTDQILDEIMAEHDARLENPLPDRAQTMNWDDLFQAMAARYGVSLDFSAEEAVRQHASPPYTRILDDAREVLEYLSGSHKLIVASMGLSIYQTPVLQGLDLYHLFDDFLMPDTTGYLKTERGFYGDYLQEKNPRIHIGDRYDHDCLIPASFGAKTVLRIPSPKMAAYTVWERPKHLTEVRDQMERLPEKPAVLPDAVITHLRELPAVIPKLLAR
jgi:FMN phosphatase YigB (HAD superfamily)